MDDILLSVGLDLKSLNQQLDKVRNVVGKDLGSGLVNQTAKAAQAQKAYAASIEKPLQGINKTINAEKNLEKIRASADVKLQKIKILEEQLGETRSTLNSKLKIYNDLSARGAISQQEHASATKGLVDSVKQISAETSRAITPEERLSKIRETSQNRIKTIQMLEQQLGQTRSTITSQLGIYNSMLQKGAITTEQHGAATARLKSQLDALNASKNNAILRIKELIGRTLLWSVTWTAMYAVVRTLTAGIKENIDFLIKFEYMMARIRSVADSSIGDIDKSMQNFQSTIFNITSRLPTGINETSSALHEFLEANLDSGKALAALEPTMKLVISKSKDLNNQTQDSISTAKTIASIYNNYGDQITGVATEQEKFEKIANVLYNTLTDQAGSLEDLNEGLKFTIGVASQARIPFEDLAAILGVLRTQGLAAGQSGRGLQQVILHLIQNSDKLAEKFGVAINPDKSLQFIEVLKKINEILVKSNGNVSALGDAYDLVGQIGGPALLALSNGFEKLEKQIASNKGEMTRLNEAVKIITDTASGQFKMLGSEIQRTSSYLLYAFEPIFGPFIKDALEQIKTGLYIINVAAISIGASFRIVRELLNDIGQGFQIMALESQALITFDKEKKLLLQQQSMELANQATSWEDYTKIIEESQALLTDNSNSYLKIKTETEETNKLAEKQLQIQEDISYTLRNQIRDAQQNLRLQVLQTFNVDKEIIAREKIKYIQENIIDVEEKRKELIEAQTELVVAQYEKWLEVAEVIRTNLNDGIFNVLKGTGSITDALVKIGDEFTKMAIDKITKEIFFKPVLDTSVVTFGNHVNTLSKAIDDFGRSVTTFVTGQNTSAVGSSVPSLSGSGLSGGAMSLIGGGVGDVNGNPLASAAAMSLIGGGVGDVNGRRIMTPMQPSPNMLAIGAGGLLPGMPNFGPVGKILPGTPAKAGGLFGGKLHAAPGGMMGNALGGLGVLGSAMSAYQTGQQSGPLAGGLSGALSGAMAGSVFGPVGTVIGGAIGGIAGIFGGLKKKKTTTVQEQNETIRITDRLDLTNRELKILNRNMLGLRAGFEGYIRQESFYLRQRAGIGVQDQSLIFSINSRRGYT